MSSQENSSNKSDYQILKDIILNNDKQASMDEAIENWQIDDDNFDRFFDELSDILIEGE